MSRSIEAPDQNAVLPADTLADSVLILLGLMAVQRLVGLVRAVLFCRWLDPEQLGQWDMAFGFLMLAGPVSVLALSSGLGRYVEHYRRRGRVRTLLARVLAACGVLGGLGAATIWFFPHRFSQWIFGTPDEILLARLLAASLLAVIAFNYFVDLFNAVRHARGIAAIQLASGLWFAVLGIVLLACWRRTTASVVIAYGGANLVAAALGGVWLARRWRTLPDDGRPLPHRELWSKVLPYTAAIWTTSLLCNVFDLADRYMIVHCLPGSHDETLALAGEYHSARVLPLLLVSVAALLSPLLTPHLSHDWEEGRRDRVSARLSLFLKILGFLMALGGAAVLALGPVLFRVALANKFAGGQAVLPGTLVYCTWFAMFSIAQNYLWCAERPRLGNVAMAAALALNIGLNAYLLPRFGLHGAVLAKCLANLLALCLVLWFSRRLGFRPDAGVWIILATPVFFPLGPVATAVALGAIAVEAVAGRAILSPEEKREIAATWEHYRRRLGYAAGQVELGCPRNETR